MARSAPLPTEVDESIEFISTTPPGELRAFWDFQLKRVASYIDLTCEIQKIWGSTAHPEIRSATGKMKSAATSALLGIYDIGRGLLDGSIRIRFSVDCEPFA